MPEAAFGRANCWLTCITIDPESTGVTNETVRLYLEKQNIQSRQIWKPMHLQPIYKEFRVFGGAVSEDLFNRGLCLPSGSGLRKDDLDRVVSGIRAALESRGN
jgi:pyridoxal phosphate-dependent aminotransferase EpsN